MKKILLYIAIMNIVVSCQKGKVPTLISDMNSAIANTSQIGIETKGIANSGRNLVYLLDPTCSVCIGNYIMVLKSLEYSECKYDSMYTIVSDDSYLINVEYFLGKDNIYRPQTERYITDNEGILTNYYYSISNNNNILLFEGDKLIFNTSVWEYDYELEIGLVRKEKE